MKIIQLDIDGTFRVLEIEELSTFLMSRFDHPGETSGIPLPELNIEVCGEFEDGFKDPIDDLCNKKASDFFNRPIHGTAFIVKYDNCIPVSFSDSEIDILAKLLHIV